MAYSPNCECYVIFVQIVDHVAKGSFTEVEAVQSSTLRELKGTFYVLSSYQKQLQGMVVKHRTDNQNVIRTLFNGSKTELIQELVVDIFKLCIELNIHLIPEWIPRSDNQWADFVSKDLDRDDYMLHPDILMFWMLCGALTQLTGSVLSVPGRSPGFAVTGQALSVKLLTLLQFHGQMKTIGCFLLCIWYLGS